MKMIEDLNKETNSNLSKNSSDEIEAIS